MKKKNSEFLNPSEGLMRTIELEGYSNSLDIGASSVIGKREEQQDTVLADDEYLYSENGSVIATLCDGMGGLQGGKIASSVCADMLNAEFHSRNRSEDLSAFYRNVIPKLDAKVQHLQDENGKPLNAGTTMVSVVVDSGILQWISVGDSRLYLIRSKTVKCLTHDHNYSMILNKKVQNGEITAKEAQNDPQKDALISYIGMGGVKYIDVNTRPFPLKNDDCILLCSDGLYRSLSDNEILNIIESEKNDMKQAAKKLTESVLKKQYRHQDNTSVILLRYIDFG